MSSQLLEYCVRYKRQSVAKKFISKLGIFHSFHNPDPNIFIKALYNFNMSTPTNIPETPMGETKQDSFFKSKEKFQQQLQDIFQTILRLTGPDQFDQLCQWMEYNQYLTIDDFYESSYNDPEKFDTKGPATEYKWKGKMNHLSANVAQKLKSFVRWMTHEDRPYELQDDFLATLTRERYLKFRHMDTLSFSTSSPSHHEPSKLKTSFSGGFKHQTPSVIRFYRSYPCFCRGVTTRRHEPHNKNTTIKQESISGALTILLPLLQALNSLEVWYFKNCGYKK